MVVGTRAAVERGRCRQGPSARWLQRFPVNRIVELRAGDVLKAAQRVDPRGDRVLCGGDGEVDGDPRPIGAGQALA